MDTAHLFLTSTAFHTTTLEHWRFLEIVIEAFGIIMFRRPYPTLTSLHSCLSQFKEKLALLFPMTDIFDESVTFVRSTMF